MGTLVYHLGIPQFPEEFGEFVLSLCPPFLTPPLGVSNDDNDWWVGHLGGAVGAGWRLLVTLWCRIGLNSMRVVKSVAPLSYPRVLPSGDWQLTT